MTPDMLLDALDGVDPALLSGARARLMPGEPVPVKRRGGLRLRLLAAAAAAAVLLGALAAAMAGNAEFRTAVFSFLHLSAPEQVPPAGEAPSGTQLGEAVQVQYLSLSLEGWRTGGPALWQAERGLPSPLQPWRTARSSMSQQKSPLSALPAAAGL